MNIELSAPQDTFKIFSSLPCFGGLESSILKRLANPAALHCYEPEQIVLLDSEPSVGLFIVQSGWLKGFKHTLSGREQVIQFIGPGEVFNEIGVLSEGENPMTVEALEPCKVWIIPHQTLLCLIETYPSFCFLIAQNLARQARQLVNLVEDLSLRSVEGRMAHLLLNQSRGGAIIRQQWFTQAEMASQLGTVQGVANRILHAFMDQGYIRIDRHCIYILNDQELKRIASLAE